MACLGKQAHMGHVGHGHCDQTKEGNLMGGLGMVLKFVYSVRQVYHCCQSSISFHTCIPITEMYVLLVIRRDFCRQVRCLEIGEYRIIHKESI